MGRNSSLEIREPFPEAAWPRVWSWTEPFRHQMSDDFSPRDLDSFVDLMVQQSAAWRTWGVYRDGELGGMLAIEPARPTTGLAHLVFKRTFWGHKTTVVAVTQMFDAVFAPDQSLIKICAMVFEQNNAVRAMCKRLGLRQEGLLKSQTVRDGRPVDVVCYGITKEEWNAITIAGADRRSGGRGGGSVPVEDVQRNLANDNGLQPAAVQRTD